MEKHYKLRRDLSIDFMGRKLFRIECTKEIAYRNIAVGKLGGYIEKEDNLFGEAWVHGDAKVFGNAKVYDNALVSGNACVFGEAMVFGNARILINAWVSGNARVFGEAKVWGNSRVCGDAVLSGEARVYGDAVVSNDELQNAEDCINITQNCGYNITITPKFIKIGCELHTKTDWWGFTDKDIIKMDGKGGLKWWKKWKPILQAICEK